MKSYFTHQNMKKLVIGGVGLVVVGHITSFIGLLAIYDLVGKCADTCKGLTWQGTVAQGGVAVAGVGYALLVVTMIGYVLQSAGNKKA